MRFINCFVIFSFPDVGLNLNKIIRHSSLHLITLSESKTVTDTFLGWQKMVLTTYSLLGKIPLILPIVLHLGSMDHHLRFYIFLIVHIKKLQLPYHERTNV